MSGKDVILITGFEPYGGCRENPSADIAGALSGTHLGAFTVESRILPVAYRALRQTVMSALAQLEPAVVLSLGLCPGAPVIRIERLAANIADFEIPDNEGRICRDQPVADEAPAALMSTLPIREIERALLDAGIPAAVSNSAGTYLCNATLFEFLRAAGVGVPCGFLHVPYTPRQAAEVLAGDGAARNVAPASMDLPTMTRAARLALETTLALQRPRAEVRTA